MPRRNRNVRTRNFSRAAIRTVRAKRGGAIMDKVSAHKQVVGIDSRGSGNNRNDGMDRWDSYL